MSQTICSVPSCPDPARHIGMCGRHYDRHLRGLPLERPCRTCGGDIRGQWKDFCSKECRASGTPYRKCVVCGEMHASTRRDLCSPRCQQLWYRHEGAVPQSVACVRCGVDIDLMTPGKAGRKRRSDVRLCRSCRLARGKRYGASASELATLHGATCGICGDAVDMSLRAPDLMRPSVDHIIPYARGGSNDASNLQLAHLHCNQLKHATLGFVLPT